jgi:hypothetical protein
MLQLGSSETRSQADHLELLQENVGEILTIPTVRSSLGDYAIRLDNIRDGLFVPNRGSDDSLHVPEAYKDTDNVAIIFSKAFQKFVLDNSFGAPTGLQRSQSQKQLRERGVSDIVVQSFLRTLGQKNEKHEREFGLLNGLVTSVSHSVDDTDFKVFARPMIVLGTWPYNPDAAKSSINFLHEAVHATQRLRYPVINVDFSGSAEHASREIEAVHMEANTLIGLKGTNFDDNDEMLQSRSLRIEEIRKRVNSKADPFYPHPEIIEFLNSQGYDFRLANA